MSNITFGRDPESGQVVSYKNGKQIGTITTMGDLVTKENMEKRDSEIMKERLKMKAMTKDEIYEVMATLGGRIEFIDVDG